MDSDEVRIAFLITRFDMLGGAQVHVRDLSLALHERGHEIVVISGIGGQLTDNLLRAGVRVRIAPRLQRQVNPVADAGALLEVRGILRRERPDLVSCHSSKAGLIGRIVGSVIGVPTIFTAHGWAFSDGVAPWKRTGYAVVERLAAPLATKIINVSDYDLALARSRGVGGKPDSDRLVRIHNGMPDVDPSRHAAPESVPPRVVMVARFQEPKDHDTLLEAMAGLRESDWMLDLVGAGPREGHVRRIARELGLMNRIRFHGESNTVDELLARAHLFVLVSRWEGFPRSILEAMRAGLPVVTTDVGGCSEAVSDGQTGFVVPPGDVGALQDRVGQLINQPSLRKAMGNEGRKVYESRFTFDRMFDDTYRIYAEVVEQEQGIVGDTDLTRI